MNLGKVEGTVVESCLSIHEAVRADGLTVEVGVEDEADTLNVLFLGELNLDGSANGSNPGVLLCTDGSVVTVDKLCHVALSRGDGRRGHDVGHLHLESGKVAVVLHKSLLELAELLLVYASRGKVILVSDCCRGTNCLTEKSAGSHNSGSTHRAVSNTDVSTCEEEVIDILGIESSVGDAEGRGCGMEDVRKLAGCDSAGMVVVHSPTAVCNGIVELTLGGNVVLSHDVITDVSTALALTGKESKEAKLPTVSVVVAAILNEVPNTERNLKKLVAELLGVCDGVVHTAKLHIPEVLLGCVESGNTVRKICLGVLICPIRRSELMYAESLLCLNETGHTHGTLVLYLGSDALVELISALSAETELCACDRSKDTVAGAVCKILCLYGVILLSGGLPTADGYDLVAVHLTVVTRAVKKLLNVGLLRDSVEENAIPEGIVTRGVVVDVLKSDLLENTGLSVIDAVRAADPHSDLARCVTAEYGSVLHNNDLGAVTCRRDCRKHTCKTAADNAEVALVDDVFEHRIHFFASRIIFL